MNPADTLLKADRAFLVAPAGCGKTQIIAEAARLETRGIQLILTHTHAGVQSLRKRLKHLGVSRQHYEVETIAGWALKLCLGFPVRSGVSKEPENNQEWQQLYAAMAELLQLRAIKMVIQASYRGVFVDEYQDCTFAQHILITRLAEILPCRVLGDPLQAIYGFRSDRVIDWDVHVQGTFDELPIQLNEPRRWMNKNERLGKWLVALREKLLAGETVDLSRNAPVSWRAASSSQPYTEEIRACYGFVGARDQTTLVLHPENAIKSRVHDFASCLGGGYCSLEEMEAHDLLNSATKIDNAYGNERVLEIVSFCKKCRTKINQLDSISHKFETEQKPKFTRKLKFQTIADLMLVIRDNDDLGLVGKLLGQVDTIPDSVIYRKELWHGMLRALNLYMRGGFSSLHEAARESRNLDRVLGRYPYQRVVARTLLVKGLEYDNAVVLWADRLDRNNLYVALTRASRTLIVYSQQPILKPRES